MSVNSRPEGAQLQASASLILYGRELNDEFVSVEAIALDSGDRLFFLIANRKSLCN